MRVNVIIFIILSFIYYTIDTVCIGIMYVYYVCYQLFIIHNIVSLEK